MFAVGPGPMVKSPSLMFCAKCGAQVSANGKFCSSCGEAVDPETDTTLLGNEASVEGATIAPSAPAPRRIPPQPSSLRTPRTPPSSNPISSSDPIGGGRFTPGQIIAERYRVVALAGRGGMGEVYRAEDLTLGQVVALKFLPETLSQDAAALARFHAEVRTARQVSHPNVCRVFDIGEADGTLFLTMEYVDGEDLASVVRRIGRLSPDKATEIARQICAGLAAAHERGVIHRDLKPANVMLDGAGKIRVMDFGLAGVAASIKGADVRAGTPAYMAPEQLAGREVSTKSDLYSLGLILYEILTGKRAFEASTIPELMKLREQGTITNPSTLVRDLDPLIERVILRCLETDPEKRPATALQVAAALPGGDPLAAALAAGEKTGCAPRVAVACFAAVILGVVLFVAVGIKENGLERIHPENSPEVLAKKAREIISSLGYTSQLVDKADGFTYDYDFLAYLEKNSPRPQWDRVLSGKPPVLRYWFRQSPRELSPDVFWSASYTPGVVTFSDPPAILSGMINVQIDPEGHLLYFQAIPPEKEENPQPARPADWLPLFSASGLDAGQFHSVESSWDSLASADTRAAWEGVWPGSGRPLHVEAASRRGKPVFFAVSGPWTKPPRMNQAGQTRADKTSQVMGLFIAFVIVGGSLFLAYRNYSRGKGDRQGALRLASLVFAVELSICLFRSHFVLTFDTIGILIFATSTAFFVSAFIWVLYLALEPYVRRNWPQTIISWTRLISGRLRDPLVGRDLLFGVLLGICWIFVLAVGGFFLIRAGASPQLGNTEFLEGFPESVAIGLVNIVGSMRTTLIFFFLVVLLRVVVKNRWVAAVLFALLFTVPKVLGSDHPMIETPVWFTVYGIAAFAVVRFSLITLAMGVLTVDVLINLPMTVDFSYWFAGRSLCVVLGFVLVAAWGFYTSLAGQRLWKGDLFE